MTRLFFVCLITISAISTVLGQQSDSFDALVPNSALQRAVEEQIPMVFVSRNNRAEWNALKQYFTLTEQDAVHPISGKPFKQKVLKVKLPLGINLPPAVPVENPMTYTKWQLGKKLYYDPILSSNNKVACASCHNPKMGFSDGFPTSVGINDAVGGMNAPTVINSGFSPLQFWDGRAASLEEQAQGPVGNPIEMFNNEGSAWEAAIKRIRLNPDYKGLFEKEFGHAATRDAVAKAIATYERTVIVGNSVHDRAAIAARVRADDEGSTKFDPIAVDYEEILRECFSSKDTHSLSALKLDLSKDEAKIGEVAASIANGRQLFFNKAQCSNCHVGESFSDFTFHNLGVGAKDGKLPENQMGRFAAQPTGHKNPLFVGAFKTPPLRGLLASKPYMHDGSEKTLANVIELYDRGGNANEFLDPKMRDTLAEAAYITAKAAGEPWKGEPVTVFTRGGQPIIPKKLKLTAQEKIDLEMFMRALEGSPIENVLHPDSK
ncbi:MAG: cytochrome c peroxidase [Zavarzinella sp.]